MIPAASCFDPVPLQGVGVRLRGARFQPDPSVAARGVCLLLGGQTEFIEKYFEVIDELRGRGFAVMTFDWRGQGGSARLLAGDTRKGFVGDFSEYDEDLETAMNWLVTPAVQQMQARLPLVRASAQKGEVAETAEGAERPTGKSRPEGVKLIALAHSMGAHILLRRLTRKLGEFDACVLNAPMIAISLRGQVEWVVRAVTALQMRRGNRAGWVWGMEARDPHRMTFQTQMVTSDPQRFARTQMLLQEHPDLRLAGATWGWLAAALRAMDELRAPGRAEAIATPLLVLGAGADRICLTPATRAFAARVPGAEYIEIAGAGHEILMERNVFRAQWWAAFDAFLKERLSL